MQAVKRLLRGIEKHEPAWGDGGKAQAEGASYGASGPGDQNALVAKRSKARIREQRWPLQVVQSELPALVSPLWTDAPVWLGSTRDSP